MRAGEGCVAPGRSRGGVGREEGRGWSVCEEREGKGWVIERVLGRQRREGLVLNFVMLVDGRLMCQQAGGGERGKGGRGQGRSEGGRRRRDSRNFLRRRGRTGLCAVPYLAGWLWPGEQAVPQQLHKG